MNRIQQKRQARHIRSVDAKHDRLITAYIKKKHPEVYEEAHQYYEALNMKYPSKRDLTKTGEFLQFATGYSTFIEYYNRPRVTDHKTKKHTVDDNMALRIPLMDSEDVNTTKLYEKADESLAIPDDVYNNLVSELAKDPQLYAIFEETTHQQHVEETTHQAEVSHQQQFEEVIEELDALLPKLHDQTPLEEELDALLPKQHDQTPLEEELEH